MRLRVLFGPLCILLLAGCRTIDDYRHWGHHGYGVHGRHHTHRPVHPPPFYRHHHVTPPAFRFGHRWHREPHSGAGREHGPRHRGHGHRRR